MPLMEEMEQVVNLFYAIASSVPNSAKSNVAVDKVLRVFTTHALMLLQQINYAVTHPNHLASLFEPVTPEERSQHEKTQGIADPLKRPLIAQLVHRMFRLSSNVVGTLLSISKADTVLCSPEEDWPLGEALVVPHSKIVVGEPASLGTLLELGNSSLDILRDFTNRPAGQALTPTASTQDNPLDVRQAIITARRNLESVLVYAVTQLAMWLSKPEFDHLGQENGDPEDAQTMEVSRTEGVKERRATLVGSAPRNSTLSSMSDRLRRGMTGEMASDLQSLLSKAKPMIAKCDTVIGKESVDITSILSTFLQERLSSNKA